MSSGNQANSFSSQLITSRSNPLIKEVLSLRNHQEREEKGLLLIEGYRELSRALKNTLAKLDIPYLFICPSLFLGDNEYLLIQEAVAHNAEIIELPSHLFEKISYRDRPDGILAIAKQWDFSLKDLDQLLKKKSSPALLLVAESIEKPGNLGTILRSADAAGADAIILCDEKTDLFNPNVVRASTGILFSLPVVRTSSAAAWEYLRVAQIQVIAATPSAEHEFTHVPMNQPLAIAVGTEQYGLSDFWMERCTLKVRIPMLGIADSLNVATATTLLLYEAIRQRRLP
jgi:TrmH family RNA methyltransferase